MINYTTRSINFWSITISLIIFLIINNIFNIFLSNTAKNLDAENNPQFQKDIQINIVDSGIKNKDEEKDKDNADKWLIEIPVISLTANIEEGTSNEIMDRSVGHFEDTAKLIGNVGLAAHNRGYKVNYFENLKKLKEGDEIFYTYKGTKKKYRVNKLIVIKDTNWSYLENTEDTNVITLITCVENEPEYRRCIQGIESEEN